MTAVHEDHNSKLSISSESTSSVKPTRVNPVGNSVQHNDELTKRIQESKPEESSSWFQWKTKPWSWFGGNKNDQETEADPEPAPFEKTAIEPETTTIQKDNVETEATSVQQNDVDKTEEVGTSFC
jgi:hypothetical protein